MAEEQTGSADYVSWLHETSSRERGISWWGDRPGWLRHAVYWTFVAAGLLIGYLDQSQPSSEEPSDWGGVAVIVWVFGILFLAGLIAMIREADYLPAVRNLSRVLILLLLLVVFLDVVLVVGDVIVWSCQADETCETLATGRQVLELLAWHAVDVVPAIDLAESTNWHRPAVSDSPIAAAAIVVLRVFVVVIVLAFVKRIWDRVLRADEPVTRAEMTRLFHLRRENAELSARLDGELDGKLGGELSKL